MSLTDKDQEVEEQIVDPDMEQMRVYHLQKRRNEILEELSVIDQSLDKVQKAK